MCSIGWIRIPIDCLDHSDPPRPNQTNVEFSCPKKVDWQKDSLNPVNPAPRGGLAGSDPSVGLQSGSDQSIGCESSGSGWSRSRFYQSNMPKQQYNLALTDRDKQEHGHRAKTSFLCAWKKQATAQATPTQIETTQFTQLGFQDSPVMPCWNLARSLREWASEAVEVLCEGRA